MPDHLMIRSSGLELVEDAVCAVAAFVAAAGRAAPVVLALLAVAPIVAAPIVTAVRPAISGRTKAPRTRAGIHRA
jgi:hypothetical protein